MWNFHYFGIFGESCDFICFLIIFYNTLCLLTQLVDNGRIWCRFDLDMFTQVYDPITDCRLGGYDSYSKKMLLCLYLRGGPKFRFHCFNKIFLYHKCGTHRLFIGHNYLFCSYNHLCIMHISDIKLDFILLTIHFIFLPAVFI